MISFFGGWCLSASNSLCVSSERELQAFGRNGMAEIKRMDSALNSFRKSPGSAQDEDVSAEPHSFLLKATAVHPRVNPLHAPGYKAVCALKAMGYGGKDCLKHVTLNCVGGSQGAGHLRPPRFPRRSGSSLQALEPTPQSGQVAPL